MANSIANVPVDQIIGALVHHYNPPREVANPSEGDALVDTLDRLPSLSREDHVDTIHVQLQKHHPGLSLNPNDHALLSFIDDAFSEALKRTDLDFKIESFIRDLAPHVAAIALTKGIEAITQQQQILSLIDLIVSECTGWSEDLGVLGDQFMEKVEVPITGLVNGRSSLEEAITQLEKVFEKEAPLNEKREQQLRDSELKVLANQKAIYHASQLLNQQMAGRQLPMFIIFLMQGTWFEFLQQVFVNHGVKSKEWRNVSKLTEALVWSLQPASDPAKRQEVIQSLPDQIRKFCCKVTFNTEPLQLSLADLEAEYEAINAGNPSDSCDFELLDVDPSMGDENPNIDPSRLKQIRSFDDHLWFIYDDKSESEEKVARIKLILNWQDTDRLLFTNHNRRKVLHMTYGEIANHLEKGSVRQLNLDTPLHTCIGNYLMQVLKNVSRQNKAEKQTEKIEERKVLSTTYLETRKQELQEAYAAHRKQAKLKEKRARTLRQKAQQKHEAATHAVESLNVDAWVKLPIMEGTLTPCKLVAVIPGNDTYIFANRAGVKVAEFTGGQLAHMIVTENSEILDTGDEFESVLANVVTGLRENRDKSYDELTGDTA